MTGVLGARPLDGSSVPFVPAARARRLRPAGGNGTMPSSSSVEGIMRGSVSVRIAIGLRQCSARTLPAYSSVHLTVAVGGMRVVNSEIRKGPRSICSD